MRAHRIRSESGITLIELMITVVIVGISAAMAAPRFEMTYERLRFKSSCTDATSTLKLARSMAITSKSQYGVAFNNAHRTVTLFKDLVNTSNFDFASGDSVIRVDTLPPMFTSVSSDVTNNVVVFRPNGSSGFSGGGNVYLIAVTENMVGLSSSNVLAATGRVHNSYSYY